MEETIETIILVVCLILGGFITAARTALASVDPGEMDERAGKGDGRAAAVQALLDLPLRTQTPLAVLNTVAIILIAVSESLLSTRTAADLGADVNGIAAAIALLFVLKAAGGILGLAYANRIALWAAYPLRFMVALTSPASSLAGWIASRLRPSRPTYADNKVTGDEIQITVLEGKEPRVMAEIAPAEKQMIAGIIELKDTTASEIMVPRIDVVALDVTQPLDEALSTVIEHGHSRLPVYEENVDHMVGILHAKDLLGVLREGRRETSLRDLLRPLHYVPEAARVSDLFHELQKRRVHMAIVVDEYGGTAGIVTIEDVLEEIVGEIRDEYDAQEEAPIVPVSDTEAIFNSRVTIGEVNDTLGLELPDDVSDTIGGLVYDRLGKMPKIGDLVTVGNAQIAVTGAVGRRIRQVRISKILTSILANGEDGNGGSTQDGV